MSLTGITFTGVDDDVYPEHIIEFSHHWPFVEWGVLIGGKGGRCRFPTDEWILLLKDRVQDIGFSDDYPNLSLHVCGQRVQNLLDGNDYKKSFTDVIIKALPIFKRCQLNFHGRTINIDGFNNLISNVKLLTDYGLELIVQLNGDNDWILNGLLDNGFIASGLYDKSHGTGASPDDWPVPNDKWKVGFAGGLGPDNVQEELCKMLAVAKDQDFWVDMESKLRTSYDVSGDQFDLWKCRQVVGLIGHYIGK